MSLKMFVPSRIPTDKAKITILKSGIFWVNRKAAEQFFKEFERGLLYFDEDRQVIGLKPTNDKENSYSLSRVEKRKDITISGMAFLKHTGINYSKTESFEPVWNEKEEMVEIRLK